MQRMIFTVAGLLLGLMLVSPARAYTPESGAWWSPAEPGTGLMIEIQDDFIGVFAFVGEPSGDPIWYLAVGFLSGNARFEGVLDRYDNGQCIGCAWRENTLVSGAGGPIRIDFDPNDPTRGTLFWGGRSLPIERFQFYLKRPEDEQQLPGVRTELTKLLGEWQAVLDFSAVTNADADFYGEVIIFDRLTFDNDGDFVDGCRPIDSQVGFCSSADADPDDPASRYAVGEYLEDSDSQLFVVNNSIDTFAAYFVEVGTNEFRGEVAVYTKGTSPSVFHPVRGFRSASRSFVQDGTGPSKAAVAARTPRPLPLSTAEGGARSKTLDSKQLAALRALEKRLEQSERTRAD